MNECYIGGQQDALLNANFRKVAYTSTHLQVVLMSVPAGEEIGEEVHDEHDQMFFIISGEGKLILGKEKVPVRQGDVVVIPVGVYHNVKSLGPEDLKMYSFCTPPHHDPATVHPTRESAVIDQEH